MTKKNINITSIILLIALTIIIGISLAIAKAEGLLAQLDLGPTAAVALNLELPRADVDLLEKNALLGNLLNVEHNLQAVLPGLQLNGADRLLERGLLS